MMQKAYMRERKRERERERAGLYTDNECSYINAVLIISV